MARIPQSTLDRLKAEIDLVELVRSSGVELSRRGTKSRKGQYLQVAVFPVT